VPLPCGFIITTPDVDIDHVHDQDPAQTMSAFPADPGTSSLDVQTILQNSHRSGKLCAIPLPPEQSVFGSFNRHSRGPLQKPRTKSTGFPRFLISLFPRSAEHAARPITFEV
jgi:hypothetical protein